KIVQLKSSVKLWISLDALIADRRRTPSCCSVASLALLGCFAPALPVTVPKKRNTDGGRESEEQPTDTQTLTTTPVGALNANQGVSGEANQTGNATVDASPIPTGVCVDVPCGESHRKSPPAQCQKKSQLITRNPPIIKTFAVEIVPHLFLYIVDASVSSDPGPHASDGRSGSSAFFEPASPLQLHGINGRDRHLTSPGNIVTLAIRCGRTPQKNILGISVGPQGFARNKCCFPGPVQRKIPSKPTPPSPPQRQR
ncbi:hypothetical protein B296_00058462, partial [Ensete ventricosum]